MRGGSPADARAAVHRNLGTAAEVVLLPASAAAAAAVSKAVPCAAIRDGGCDGARAARDKAAQPLPAGQHCASVSCPAFLQAL